MDTKPPPYTVQGGPAPQTGYPDPPPPQQQTVIVQQPVVQFKDYPVTLPDGGYPPPQQGYPPPQQGYQQGATTVVVQQQPVTVQVFGQTPVTLPDGNVTTLQYQNGTLTWLLVGLICLFTWGFGLCCLGLIPLCIDGAKDIHHINPATGQVVGVYKRI